MEQYKTENVKLEKDLPMLREVAGGTWKKEDELKQLKSEVAHSTEKYSLHLLLHKRRMSRQIPQMEKHV